MKDTQIIYKLNLPRDIDFFIPKEELYMRIKKLQNYLDNFSCCFIFSNIIENHPDSLYSKFRQNSDFYYFTGLEITPAILYVTCNEVILFYNEPDPEEELWTGIKPNHKEIKNYLAFISDIFLYDEFKQKLFSLLENKKKVYYPFGINLSLDQLLFSELEHKIRKSRNNIYFPTQIIHNYEILFEIRSIKSLYEIEQIKQIMEITKEAHLNLWKLTKPGMFEYELDAILTYTFLKNNAQPAYPNIVASGSNACILHYTKNNALIKENDLILIDAAARKNYLNTDITRTYPANKKFNNIQKMLYNVVLEAQEKAIEKTKIGYCMEDSHFAALNTIIDFLKQEKILNASKEEIIEKELYKPYYMHRTGHYLGYDVHDRGYYNVYTEWNKEKICNSEDHKNFRSNIRNIYFRKFEPYMVCTVEPGLYFSPALENIPEEWKGIGIRIEDNVLVTEEKWEVLSKDIPKKINDIEKNM